MRVKPATSPIAGRVKRRRGVLGEEADRRQSAARAPYCGPSLTSPGAARASAKYPISSNTEQELNDGFDSRRTEQTPIDYRPGGAALPFPRAAGQAGNHPNQAYGDPAGPVAGLFAGRRGSSQGDRRRSLDVLRLYLARQHGRGHYQWDRDPGTRQPRRAGVEAGDG